MQVNKSFPQDTKALLSVVAHQTDLEPIKLHVLRHLQTKLKVAGFREGKVPLALVEKNIDANTLQSEFLEEAINHLYQNVVKELRVRVVSQPEVSVKKFVPFTELEFDASVDVIGEMKLPNYKKMKRSKEKAKITAKDIDTVLQNLLTRAAEKNEVKRVAKNGDEVRIDFKGTDNKKEPINGADGSDYPLLLGSNTFIPGFEPNLVGTKAGEQKSFNLKFPKDYGVKALAGKDVTFAVTVKQVLELKQPKLDDLFAASVGPFKSLADLKTDIKKQLAQEKQSEIDRAFENELVLEIANKTKVSIPDRLVDEQVQRMEEEERRNLNYRGQTWPEHLKEEGVTEEEHRQTKRPQALEQLKAGLVLSEIAEAEKLEVTPEEVEVRIQLLRGQYRDAAMQAELDKPENRRDIASRILTEKTLQKLESYLTK